MRHEVDDGWMMDGYGRGSSIYLGIYLMEHMRCRWLSACLVEVGVDLKKILS
jgi:hypothetical protein